MKEKSRFLSLESFTFLCFVLIVFVVDLVVPKSIVIGTLYTLPVCASLFLGNDKEVIKLTALFSIFLILIGLPLSGSSLLWIDWVNRGIACILVLFTYYLCNIFKRGFTRKVQFEDRFLAALDATPNAMIMVDFRGTIVIANNVASELFGYQQDELISSSIEMLVPEESRRNHPQLRMNYFRQPRKRSMGEGSELFGVKKSGEKIPLEIALNPIESEGEQFVMAAIVDISIRKKTLKQLRIQNEKLERSQRGTINLLKDFKNANLEKSNTIALLDGIRASAAHALITTTIDGIITSFNVAAEKMLGFTSEELVGKKTPAVFHDVEEVVQRSQKFSKKLNKPIKPDFETFVCYTDLGLKNQMEWVYVHKNGDRFPVLVSITALFNSSGEKTGYLGIAQDISEIKKVERKLRESNEDLERFAYIASHDLKAPVRGIGNIASYLEEDLEELLKNDDELQKNVKKNLDRIVVQVARMQNLINGILEYSKVSTTSTQIKNINLEELINDVVNEQGMDTLFKVTINSSSVDLRTEVVKLSQVISNIINNAIKYHNDPDTGVIEISSEVVGNKIKISIRDNGPGIDPKYHEKIFEIFQTLQPKDQHGSTGVGLALVRKIVKSKNCDLKIESEVGLGTNFIFTWPLNEETGRPMLPKGKI